MQEPRTPITSKGGNRAIRSRGLSVALVLVTALTIVGCRPRTDRPAGPTDGEGPVASAPVRPEADGAESVPGERNEAPAEGQPGVPPITREDIARANPPRPPDIPRPGTSGWTASRLSAAEVGRRMAQAIEGMRGVEGVAETTVETPEGRGQIRTTIAVRDNRNYRIEFPIVALVPDAGVMAANGTTRSLRIGTKTTPPFPIDGKTGDADWNASQIARNWNRDFGRLIFRGLTEGRDALGPLIAEWSRPQSGFRVTTEERSREFRGRTVTNYRIRASRAARAGQGASEVEIVIDGERGLPVTIRSIWTDDRGREWRAQWSAGWNFERKIVDEQLVL